MNATIPNDSRILSLFREWVVAERVAGALAEDEKFDGSDEYYEALRRTNKLVAAISDIPAVGAAGLAIKSYLTVQAEDIMRRDDVAALSSEAANHADLTRSILEDAVRFVPELAPFAAAALALGEPDAKAEDDDAEPEDIGFGEPEERP
jgi:hypothetical protein